jgi:hypothetical protein
MLKNRVRLFGCMLWTLSLVYVFVISNFWICGQFDFSINTSESLYVHIFSLMVAIISIVFGCYIIKKDKKKYLLIIQNIMLIMYLVIVYLFLVVIQGQVLCGNSVSF